MDIDSSIKVVVFVNHFNPTSDPRIDYQSLLCCLSYVGANIKDIVLIDSSGHKNNELESILNKYSIHYYKSEKACSFSRAFNYMFSDIISKYDKYYAIYSANDIFVGPNFLSKILHYISEFKIFGCIIPYLSESDLLEQNLIFSHRLRRSSGMTLNINIFHPDVIKQSIVNLDEDLGGCFNDMVLFKRLIDFNYIVYLVDCGKITHIGKGTVDSSSSSSSSSSSNYLKDKKTALIKYPDLISKSGIMDVNHFKLSQEFSDLILFWLVEHIHIPSIQLILLFIRSKIILRFF